MVGPPGQSCRVPLEAVLAQWPLEAVFAWWPFAAPLQIFEEGYTELSLEGRGGMIGRTLYVVRGKDYADLYLEGEEREHYFRVRDHPEHSGWFVVEEHRISQDGSDQVVRICSSSYWEIGVEDFRGLIWTLITEPQSVFADLTGIKTRIRKVETRCE